MINNRQALISGIQEVARVLSVEGRKFNTQLIEQFESIWKEPIDSNLIDLTRISSEHLIFYQSIVQTLNWIQDQKKDKYKLLHIYLQILIKAANIENKKQVTPQVQETLNDFNLDTPRRLYGVIGSLETWTRVELPAVKKYEVLDLEQVQDLAFQVSYELRRPESDNKKAHRYDIRWTTLAPLKMYAILKGTRYKTPERIYPPMGKAVSKGIEEIWGIRLGESTKDYTISRDLHLKLANSADEDTSIWDINSGLYRLGGGS